MPAKKKPSKTNPNQKKIGVSRDTFNKYNALKRLRRIPYSQAADWAVDLLLKEQGIDAIPA